MEFKAFFSTPEHNASFVGRWFWVYESKGKFRINPDSIECTSGRLNLRIEKEKIESIELGTFPRTAKPKTFNYIDIRYKEDENSSIHIYVVPLIPNRISLFTPVWDTNKHTLEQIDTLTAWRQKSSSRGH